MNQIWEKQKRLKLRKLQQNRLLEKFFIHLVKRNDVDEKNRCNNDELDDFDPQNRDVDEIEGKTRLVCGKFSKNEIWLRCWMWGLGS